MIKWLLFISLIGMGSAVLAAQEWMPKYQEGAAHFGSPANRYGELSYFCKPYLMVVPAGPHYKAVKKHLIKNGARIKEQIDFFLKHKHLSLQERNTLWAKLQKDAQLKKGYDEYQKWLAQKAQEPVKTSKEETVAISVLKSLPRAKPVLLVNVNDAMDLSDDEMSQETITPRTQRRDSAVPKESRRSF